MAMTTSPARYGYSNHAYATQWDERLPRAGSSRRRLSWQQREPPVGSSTATWRGEDPRAVYPDDAWPQPRRSAQALLSPRLPPRVPQPRVAVQRRHSEVGCRWPSGGETTVTPRKEVPRQIQREAALPSPSRSLKASWITLPEPLQEPPTTALCVSACLLVVAGLATCVAGFCFLAWEGRRYFLDVALVSGFCAFLLGAAGLRARSWLWFPNRNYVSGYMLLAIFSVLTAAGLATLLTYKPRPGTPLADMVGGAICGVSGLSLLLAGLGVVASRCCKYPPPDNRVQHCAEGFVI